MKKLLILIGAILVSSFSFAGSSGPNKASPQLNALGSVWKNHSLNHPPYDKNDIVMGYVGQDVSDQPIAVA